MTALDWKDEARSLRRAGLSEREIAESVGRAASSVHEAVKDVEPDPQPDPASNGSGRVSAEQAAEFAHAAGLDEAQNELDDEPSRTPVPSPGQQTIDGQEVRPPIEELRVDGTTQLGMIDFGGKKPQSAGITLTGGSFELLEGRAFRKGDVVHFEGTAVVWDVGGTDKHDPKTGIVVSAKQRHKARITDLRVKGPS